MRRCRHRWEEVRRYFVPPTQDAEIENGTIEFGRELAQGVTIVELRCVECGDVSWRKLPGDAT